VNLSEENHAQELLITELKARITELEEELVGKNAYIAELSEKLCKTN